MAKLRAEKREQKRLKDKRRMTSLSDQLKVRKPVKRSPKIHVVKKKSA